MIIRVLIATLFTLSAQADMVFMRESTEGKHIYLKTDTALTRLTDDSSWHLYPDITPDGNWTCWVEGSDTDLSIVTLNLKSQKKESWKVPLSGLILHPNFSGNGKMLFFSAPVEEKKNALYMINLDEARQRDPNSNTFHVTPVKIDESETAYFPRPSADGNLLVYHRSINGKREVVYFDRIMGKKTVIAEGMSPALSFDEKFIAYTVKENGNWNIHLYNRFEQKYSQATSSVGDEMAPAFKPDGTLVFSSNKSGQYKLYALSGNAWTQITDGPGDDYAPQFSGSSEVFQGKLAPYTGNARSSFGTIVHNGKLYMVGGHQGKEHTYPPESFSDAVVVYDQATNQWTDLAPRPHKAHGFQLAARGNYIYAFGGFAYNENFKPKWHSLDVIDRYDISKNEWTTIGRMPRKRSSNAAITIGDKVYLAGGWDSTPKFDNDLDGTFQRAIDIFDLNDESCIEAHFSLPDPLRRAFTGINHDGKLLLIGGISAGASHFDLLSKITSIDPVTGAVKELPELPYATFAPAAEVLDGQLYVFGGMYKMGPMEFDYVAHIYSMNLESHQWQHVGRYVEETKGFSQVFKLNDSTLGILGGHHYFEGYDLPVTTFETFSHLSHTH